MKIKGFHDQSMSTNIEACANKYVLNTLNKA